MFRWPSALQDGFDFRLPLGGEVKLLRVNISAGSTHCFTGIVKLGCGASRTGEPLGAPAARNRQMSTRT
jgi:hypothetical protein